MSSNFYSSDKKSYTVESRESHKNGDFNTLLVTEQRLVESKTVRGSCSLRDAPTLSCFLPVKSHGGDLR